VTAAAEFFAALPERLGTADEAFGGAVIAFALAGAPDGGWSLLPGADGPEVVAGAASPADVTVTCAREHWEQLCDGRMSPQTAWATGLLEVSGDMRLAQRLRVLLGI
jgi:ubiquinone biosynthesis protein UbiJ